MICWQARSCPLKNTLLETRFGKAGVCKRKYPLISRANRNESRRIRWLWLALLVLVLTGTRIAVKDVWISAFTKEIRLDP